MTIIFDIDGVLANNDGRLHYILNEDGSRRKDADWEAFYRGSKDDPVIEAGVHLLICLYEGMGSITFLTGRSEAYRDLTMKWFHKMDLDWLAYPSDALEVIMRPEEDYRPDYEFKLEAIRRLESQGHNIELVVDDSIRVIDHLVANGYVCLHFRRPGEQRGHSVGKAHNEKIGEEAKA